MTHAAELCPPCDSPSSKPSRIRPFLTRLLAPFPRRLDTVDRERMSRYLLRDIGLSE
jgi:hypothetical protein